MRNDERRQMPAELVLMEQRYSHGTRAAGNVGAGWVDWEPASAAAGLPSRCLRFRQRASTALWACRLAVRGCAGWLTVDGAAELKHDRASRERAAGPRAPAPAPQRRPAVVSLCLPE